MIFLNQIVSSRIGKFFRGINNKIKGDDDYKLYENRNNLSKEELLEILSREKQHFAHDEFKEIILNQENNQQYIDAAALFEIQKHLITFNDLLNFSQINKSANVHVGNSKNIFKNVCILI